MRMTAENKSESAVSILCKVCSAEFFVTPFYLNVYSTCSKECSKIYFSIINKGKIVSEETRKKISIARKGKKTGNAWVTDEIREKRRELGKRAGNIGDRTRGTKLSDEHRKKLSDSHKGKSSGGWKLSQSTRDKMSLARRGDKTNFWKGGVTKESALIRSSAKYKEWRKSVFERDNYTCQICNVKGVFLHADHIKPFASHKELRFDISNGRTLCVECHKNTPTYLNRWHEEFVSAS